jgi:hypothetical protein
VFYSVADPMVYQLLDVARQILTSSLLPTRDLLDELQGTGATSANPIIN